MTHQERIAKNCIRQAQAILGAGWDHVSKDIQWGLVSANVLALFDQQDDEVSPERIVAHTRGVLKAARTIFEEGAW